jgi:hypothetical protein
MTNEEKEARGREALALINNPILKEALEKIKSDVIDKWSNTPAKDTESREWLWRHFQVTGHFEQLLVEVINTGKIAEETLRLKKPNVFNAAFDYFRKAS